MAKKKMRKNTKRSSVKQKNNRTAKSTNLILKMEKDFREMPNKFLTHCRKELTAQKSLESKLNKSLQSAQKQMNGIKNKFAALVAKAKDKKINAAMKKQVNKIEKSYALSKQSVATLTKQIDQVQQSKKQASAKESQWIWLKKQIAEMAKQPWKKVEKTAKPTVKKSAAKKAKATVSSFISEATHQEIPTHAPAADSSEFNSN